mgnify:CR=1 FL=1
MKRKILAALLAACTILSITGCAGGKDPVSETSKESSTAAESSAVESQAEEVKELLPYTGDEVTFTYFWFDMGDNFETKKDLPMVQAVQEKMGNIKLELELLPISDYYTKMPLLLAGGEIPDIMVIPDVSNTLSTYGKNDIFLDWAPLLASSMPNMKKYADELSMFDGLLDAEGHMYGVPIYVNSEDYIMQTWMTNATLLKEQNIEIPATQDEFLEACRKIKANTDVTPLQRRYGLTSLMDSIGLMYKNGGDRTLAYNPDEKTWEFGPTKEGSELKAYLTFMHTLWKENLIDHEINTMSEDQYNDYIKSGRFAFTNDYITTFSNVTEYEPAVIPTPAGTGCKVAIDSARDAKCVWAAVSSKETEHPELLATCIDLMFSDEIATLENYGIEGVTYELKDGEKDFLGNIRAASNNFTGTESLADYGANGNAWMRTFGVTDTNATRLLGESPVIYEGVNNIISLLDAKKQQPRYQYSYPTLTEDENSELSDITTPVTTYLDECMAKFIIGDMDLDADWDTFMTKLQGYGDMARACEILNSKEMATFSGNWR